MTSVPRIDVDDPDVDMDHAQRLLYRGTPFTGEVAEYQDEQLISLDEYTEGVAHGKSREWYRDGTLRSEGTVRDGRAWGEFKEWRPNGTLRARKYFDSSPASLREEDTWDEQGAALTSWRRDEG
ncbi:toxin-antitoxin system YwqK family antitoxin [Streptomyces chrestomyceticus]|uniref:toxin-antitoxin system YwqK family antitoxin n=1 Tax=Streptomyces chrestomyceticus TaxID=68185 RepID=UPI0004CAB382